MKKAVFLAVDSILLYFLMYLPPHGRSIHTVKVYTPFRCRQTKEEFLRQQKNCLPCYIIFSFVKIILLTYLYQKIKGVI